MISQVLFSSRGGEGSMLQIIGVHSAAWIKHNLWGFSVPFTSSSSSPPPSPHSATLSLLAPHHLTRTLSFPPSAITAVVQ